MITELIGFEPEICICNGNELEFKRESVSVMRDFLLKFSESWFCNGNQVFWQRDSVSVIGNEFLPEKVSACNRFGYYGTRVTLHFLWYRRLWLLHSHFFP